MYIDTYIHTYIYTHIYAYISIIHTYIYIMSLQPFWAKFGIAPGLLQVSWGSPNCSGRRWGSWLWKKVRISPCGWSWSFKGAKSVKKSVSKPRGCRKSFLQNLRDSMRLSRGATLRLLEPILKNAPKWDTIAPNPEAPCWECPQLMRLLRGGLLEA